MIVLVGQRKAATEAAQRLREPFVVVADTTDRVLKRRSQTLKASFLDVDGLLKVASKLAALGEPTAVIPVTERSVVAAAVIRDNLRLGGDSIDTAQHCTDKLLMKMKLTSASIPCTPFVCGNSELKREQLVADLGLPLYIKPRLGSGGRGLRVIHALSDMPWQFSSDDLIERHIDGIELSVESFVVDGKVEFANVTEYFIPRWANILPHRLPSPLHETLLDLNRRVIQVLGISYGITHLEAFHTHSGWIVGEIATRPPGGHLMRLLDLAYGIDSWRNVFDAHRGRKLTQCLEHKAFVGVLVLHPGAGQLIEIDGLDAVKQSRGIIECRLNINRGDAINARLGAGQEVGHVIAAACTRDEVAVLLKNVQRDLKFILAV